MHTTKAKLVLTAGVIVTVTAIWFLANLETRETVAKRLIACIERADGACLMRYAHRDEIEAYGLTEEKLSTFLEEYVLPTYETADRLGESVEHTDSGTVTRFVNYQFPDSRTGVVMVRVVKTSYGTQCQNLLTGLMLRCFDVRYKVDPSGSAYIDKKARQRISALTDRDVLEGLGIHGVYRSKEEGLLNWDEWIALCEQRMLEASQAGGS